MGDVEDRRAVQRRARDVWLVTAAREEGAAPTSTAGRVAPYVSLLRRNSAFRRVYAAQLVSFAGDWFAQVALLSLALELSGSAVIAALVLVLQMGGYAFLAPVGG